MCLQQGWKPQTQQLNVSPKGWKPQTFEMGAVPWSSFKLTQKKEYPQRHIQLLTLSMTQITACRRQSASCRSGPTCTVRLHPGGSRYHLPGANSMQHLNASLVGALGSVGMPRDGLAPVLSKVADFATCQTSQAAPAQSCCGLAIAPARSPAKHVKLQARHHPAQTGCETYPWPWKSILHNPSIAKRQHLMPPPFCMDKRDPAKTYLKSLPTPASVSFLASVPSLLLCSGTSVWAQRRGRERQKPAG